MPPSFAATGGAATSTAPPSSRSLPQDQQQQQQQRPRPPPPPPPPLSPAPPLLRAPRTTAAAAAGGNRESRQAELIALRQRGIARAFHRHFTESAESIARERAAAEMALRELEKKKEEIRKNPKKYMTDGSGGGGGGGYQYDLTMLEAMCLELKKRKDGVRRKELEAKELYKRYCAQYGHDGSESYLVNPAWMRGNNGTFSDHFPEDSAAVRQTDLLIARMLRGQGLDARGDGAGVGELAAELQSRIDAPDGTGVTSPMSPGRPLNISERWKHSGTTGEVGGQYSGVRGRWGGAAAAAGGGGGEGEGGTGGSIGEGADGSGVGDGSSSRMPPHLVPPNLDEEAEANSDSGRPLRSPSEVDDASDPSKTTSPSALPAGGAEDMSSYGANASHSRIFFNITEPIHEHDGSDHGSEISGITSVDSRTIVNEAELRLAEFLRIETENIRKMLKSGNDLSSVGGGEGGGLGGGDDTASVAGTVVSKESRIGEEAKEAARAAEEMVRKMEEMMAWTKTSGGGMKGGTEGMSDSDDEGVGGRAGGAGKKAKEGGGAGTGKSPPKSGKVARRDDGQDDPDVWCAYWSDEHAREYYHQASSGTTTWSRPSVGTVDESTLKKPKSAKRAGGDSDEMSVEVKDYTRAGSTSNRSITSASDRPSRRRSRTPPSSGRRTRGRSSSLDSARSGRSARSARSGRSYITQSSYGSHTVDDLRPDSGRRSRSRGGGSVTMGTSSSSSVGGGNSVASYRRRKRRERRKKLARAAAAAGMVGAVVGIGYWKRETVGPIVAPLVPPAVKDLVGSYVPAFSGGVDGPSATKKEEPAAATTSKVKTGTAAKKKKKPAATAATSAKKRTATSQPSAKTSTSAAGGGSRGGTGRESSSSSSSSSSSVEDKASSARTTSSSSSSSASSPISTSTTRDVHIPGSGVAGVHSSPSPETAAGPSSPSSSSSVPVETASSSESNGKAESSSSAAASSTRGDEEAAPPSSSSSYFFSSNRAVAKSDDDDDESQREGQHGSGGGAVDLRTKWRMHRMGSVFAASAAPQDSINFEMNWGKVKFIGMGIGDGF